MMKKLPVGLLLAAALGYAAVIPGAEATTNSSLTVSIDGLRNTQGQVCLNVFASSQGFPMGSDRAVQARCVSITETPTTVTFNNLRAGSYAIAVIHDANGDGTLNRNGLGIPTEGFGFSRNPRIRTGPPSFGDAAIVVAGPNTRVQIQLQYFL